MCADHEPFDEFDPGVVALQARFDPAVEIGGDQIAVRSARGEDQAGDSGLACTAADRDDTEDRIGIERAGDDDEPDAAALRIQQDRNGVVAERGGERKHSERVGSRSDRIDAPTGHTVGGVVTRHGVPFRWIGSEGKSVSATVREGCDNR